MKDKKYRKNITVGSVTLFITKVEKGSRAGSFRVQGYKDGKNHVFGTYTTLNSAETKAKAFALEKAQGDEFLNDLTDKEILICKYAIENELTIEDLMPIVLSKAKTNQATLSTVLDEWYDRRSSMNDYAETYLRDLRRVKSKLIEKFGEDYNFNAITADELDDFLDWLSVGAKRRKNLRSVLVAIWKWSSTVKRYSTENVATMLEVPKIARKRGGHEVLTPKEFALLLVNVQQHFLPWLVISGFAGLRGSEIYGAVKREDDRLRWEDFDWKNKRISVRPETSKTSLHRYIPICDTLAEWLDPYIKSTGFVHNGFDPSYSNKSRISETSRLGAFIGGWRSNCLRASRASYRLAQTNDINLTALEDGHTVEQLKSNYLNPRYAEDAELWFSLTKKNAEALLSNELIDFKKA